MIKDQRKRGVRATDNGLKKIVEAKATRLGGGKRLTIEKLAEESNVSEQTVKRFLKGLRIDQDYAMVIVKALNLEYKDIIEDK
ncbi:MAG: helix-turn-helix transcriptional regulator [Richelia sp. RM1_1_1]|nr:helix-turn-helix transcriptional regulator [Richelia sp. RM1_1_1]